MSERQLHRERREARRVQRRQQKLAVMSALWAVLEDPKFWEAADRIPTTDPSLGGRPRDNPDWVIALYGCLADELKSALAAQNLLADVWHELYGWSLRTFATEPELQLDSVPVQTWHYDYMKKRYFTPEFNRSARVVLRAQGVDLARLYGLFKEGGSLTHPSLDRVMEADGFITAAPSAHPKGSTFVDPDTGEIRPHRFAPGARNHTTGDKTKVYGHKQGMLSARAKGRGRRVILDAYDVRSSGREMEALRESLHEVLPMLPETQAVLYDGAARGESMDYLMKQFGVWLICPPHRQDEKPTELPLDLVVPIGGDGRTIELWLWGKCPAVREIDAAGEVKWLPLKKGQSKREQLASGLYTFKTVFHVPDEHGGGVVWLRHDNSEADIKAGFNRAENVRAFGPQGDLEEWKRLYPRRSDTESSHRQRKRHLPDKRARSYEPHHQLTDLIFHALMWNAKARALELRRQHPPGELAAA